MIVSKRILDIGPNMYCWVDHRILQKFHPELECPAVPIVPFDCFVVLDDVSTQRRNCMSHVICARNADISFIVLWKPRDDSLQELVTLHVARGRSCKIYLIIAVRISRFNWLVDVQRLGRALVAAEAEVADRLSS